LKVGDIQRREDHWAIVDLVGKAGHVRTVPVPAWVKTAVDRWTECAPIANGRLFRSIRKNGTVWGNGIIQNVIWYVVKACATRAGITRLAPHDLRRTCARLCHAAGGELEQIQFLLGHASVQTTERYIGSKQDLTRAVNDRSRSRSSGPDICVIQVATAKGISQQLPRTGATAARNHAANRDGHIPVTGLQRRYGTCSRPVPDTAVL
jgi:integrase